MKVKVQQSETYKRQLVPVKRWVTHEFSTSSNSEGAITQDSF